MVGSELELHQVIYAYLLAQIQFGYYRCGESLPRMEELCRQSHISIDTVAQVYHRLRREGVISLTQKAGAKVSVSYSQEEIDGHVRHYFAQREAALRDLSWSIWPLFGWALWLSLKHSPPEAAERMVHLTRDEERPPTVIWHYLEQQYGALGNDLLMRLMRYLYLFFQGPFYSVKENTPYFEKGLFWQQNVAVLSRNGNWATLRDVLKTAQDDLAHALSRFYEDRIAEPVPQIGFCWNAYKKSAQLRYSLAVELLTDISRGIYPVGSFLPPAHRLAVEKGVSISTVRRTLSLLGGIGAVKSFRSRGAQVLSPMESTENADLTQPDIQNRLLDMAKCLQIYALSARAVSELTLASLDCGGLRLWKERLLELRDSRRLELMTYVSMGLISEHTPSQTIRTIYSELLRLLFWGHPLRGLRGTPETINRVAAPFLNRMLQALDERDVFGFSTVLEELVVRELCITVNQLVQLGIRGAENILIPVKGEFWEMEK